ncbi:MAG: ArsR family transcriptional regulator [Methanobacteriota archaeon]
MHQRLILQYLPKPGRRDLHEEAYWLCDTLGLSSGRDIEDLSIQIVLRLLEESSMKEGVASEHLADLLDINVGRVNHHLRNLSRSGVIYRNRRLVHLRGRSLLESVQELRRDADRIFDELEKVATDIDQMMGLPGAKGKGNEPCALVPISK